MKIGVLSDTHDLLRSEVTEALQGCDRILHAGDISSREILDRLNAIAPVKVVRGNNDKDWAEGLPSFLDFDLGGLRICMAHKKKDLPKDLAGYDLAVCGHSHQYAETWLDTAENKRTLLLNPGSCGPRRFVQPITLAILTVSGNSWSVRQIVIPHTAKEKAPGIDSGNIYPDRADRQAVCDPSRRYGGRHHDKTGPAGETVNAVCPDSDMYSERGSAEDEPAF